MTCIAGLVDRATDTVTIGGDSAGVAGWSLTVRADTKVFAVGPAVFGFTSSFRMGQALRYGFALPPVPDADGDLTEYMVCAFVDAVRARFKAAGYARREHEVETAGEFLVGLRGRLFRIGSDYQVGEAVLGFDAIGCGADAAAGALHALTVQGLMTDDIGPVRRVLAALAAAEATSIGVRGPFHVVIGDRHQP